MMHDFLRSVPTTPFFCTLHDCGFFLYPERNTFTQSRIVRIILACHFEQTQRGPAEETEPSVKVTPSLCSNFIARCPHKSELYNRTNPCGLGALWGLYTYIFPLRPGSLFSLGFFFHLTTPSQYGIDS